MTTVHQKRHSHTTISRIQR
uniref:Uncharacterized protein n=1 Tax=Arundo donax TaxID=35708 RepID=A0A0A8XSY3_ARUDO